MGIYFSRHAKRQMKWRTITEDEVRTAVQSPEKVDDSIKERKNAFKHVDDKWLKVTFKMESDKVVIITVIDKSK